MLAALLQARATGKGAVVETSLMRTGIYANSWSTSRCVRAGRMVKPLALCIQSALQQLQSVLNPIWDLELRFGHVVGAESSADRCVETRAPNSPK